MEVIDIIFAEGPNKQGPPIIIYPDKWVWPNIPSCELNLLDISMKRYDITESKQKCQKKLWIKSGDILKSYI